MADVQDTIKAMPNVALFNSFRVEECDCDICGRENVKCKEVTSIDKNLKVYDKDGKFIKTVHESWMACSSCRSYMWDLDILHR